MFTMTRWDHRKCLLSDKKDVNDSKLLQHQILVVVNKNIQKQKPPKPPNGGNCNPDGGRGRRKTCPPTTAATQTTWTYQTMSPTVNTATTNEMTPTFSKGGVSTSQQSTQSHKSDDTSGGVIGGAVVGAIGVAVAVTLILIFVCWKRKKNKNKTGKTSGLGKKSNKSFGLSPVFRQILLKRPTNTQSDTQILSAAERPQSSVYAEIGPLDNDIIGQKDQNTGHTNHASETGIADVYDTPTAPDEGGNNESDKGAYFILEPEDQNLKMNSNGDQRHSTSKEDSVSPPSPINEVNCAQNTYFVLEPVPSGRLNEQVSVSSEQHRAHDSPKLNGVRPKSHTYEVPTFVNEQEHPYDALKTASTTTKTQRQEQHTYFTLENESRQEDLKFDDKDPLHKTNKDAHHKNSELNGPYEFAKPTEDVHSADIDVSEDPDYDYEYDHLNQSRR